jgi:uncharacterized protein
MTLLFRVVITILMAIMFTACATQPQTGRIEQVPQRKYVLDSTSLLTREQSSEIHSLISNHNRFGFGQIKLIVIQQLPENTSIEDYAHAILQDDLATAERRLDRALLVVALTDRKLRIETSTAVWPVLSDEFCKKVIDNQIVPQFKQGNFFIGIRNGLNALIAKLNKPNEKPTTGDGPRFPHASTKNKKEQPTTLLALNDGDQRIAYFIQPIPRERTCRLGKQGNIGSE